MPKLGDVLSLFGVCRGGMFHEVEGQNLSLEGVEGCVF